MNIDPTITRPILRYPGSKWRIAPWIHSYIPESHDTYNEPFVGTASVLLRKHRSRMENVNDASGDLTNFLITLRTHETELIRAIEMTYYSQAEWEIALEPADDCVERARRFYVRCYMSIRPFDTSCSFRRQYILSRGKNGTSSPMTPSARQFMRTDHLRDAAARLRGVAIENMDALEFIQVYDYDRAFFYVDPPYPFHTRANRSASAYPIDNMAIKDHVHLARALHDVEGMVIISGYACKLYRRLYENFGWQRVDRNAPIDGGGMAVESLWISPQTWAALKQEQAGREQALESERIEREKQKLPLFADQPFLFQT